MRPSDFGLFQTDFDLKQSFRDGRLHVTQDLKFDPPHHHGSVDLGYCRDATSRFEISNIIESYGFLLHTQTVYTLQTLVSELKHILQLGIA